MSASQVATSDPAVESNLLFLQELLGNYHPRNFAIRLWDGTTWEAEDGQPTHFTVVLQHPGALRTLFWFPSELSLGEAYIYDDVDIEGNLEEVFRLVDFLTTQTPTWTTRLMQIARLLALPRSRRPRRVRPTARLAGQQHTPDRDKEAISYHYDLSNDFYQLWLDRRMVYTCAYFDSVTGDLDTAQERKLDYICRKLRLQPGERLLDIGCGWGGLLIHAARHYGVEAVGITLSNEQADLAHQRIHEAGLSDRCRVEIRDYRDLRESESFDKLVSIGMIEAIGESKLPVYFAQALRLLKPGGVFLNHGINESVEYSQVPGLSFTTTYVFPDGELSPLNVTLRTAETAGLEIRDVESLREHYVLTLRHWIKRLEACQEQARRLTDDVTYRIWRLYMSGSAYGFRVGRLNLYQTLLSKPRDGVSGLPLHRADWYA